MSTEPGLRKPGDNEGSVRPKLIAFALKLGLTVVLAGALAVGIELRWATFFLAFQALCTTLAAVSVALALFRDQNWPAKDGHFREALALGIAALLSHLAYTLIR